MPLRRFLALSPGDRYLLAEALARLTLAWVAIRIVPFRLLARSIRHSGTRHLTQVEVRKIQWAVEAVANRFPGLFPCLPRGFASIWMLQERGAAPRMHYGVARGTAGFEAHVWVELEGMPVVGFREASTFTILTSFPS